jgi:hypothetical protein
VLHRQQAAAARSALFQQAVMGAAQSVCLQQVSCKRLQVCLCLILQTRCQC